MDNPNFVGKPKTRKTQSLLNKSRAERVEEHVEYLLTTPDYHPYMIDNFAEAMSNVPYEEIAAIANAVREAVRFRLDSPDANRSALYTIMEVVEDYWSNIARRVAERVAK